MSVRIRLDFIVSGIGLPPSTRLLDGFEGAVQGLYGKLLETADVTILPGGKASFTDVRVAKASSSGRGASTQRPRKVK